MGIPSNGDSVQWGFRPMGIPSSGDSEYIPYFMYQQSLCSVGPLPVAQNGIILMDKHKAGI